MVSLDDIAYDSKVQQRLSGSKKKCSKVCELTMLSFNDLPTLIYVAGSSAVFGTLHLVTQVLLIHQQIPKSLSLHLSPEPSSRV